MTHKTLPGITVDIARAEIERQLAALNSRNSLTPSVPQRGWTGNDMLALAGICLAAAMSHGPETWGTNPRTFERDMCGTVLAYCMLTFLTMHEKFEAEYGDYVLAFAEVTSDAPNITIRVIHSGKAN